jgi:acyl CoA:acetate/3-ketoacid CoA transferase alpha subunit
MQKTVKCILLKYSNVLITEIVEVGSELGEPDCKLINPYKIDPNGNLTPWLDITNQNEMMIHSDSILTIVDPTEEIVEKYLNLTS